MELKPGYKQTEVGVIPEDWEVASLGLLIGSLNAGVSVNSVEKDKNLFAHDESILKTSCVFGGKFIPEEHKQILPSDIHRAKLTPRKDSIIFSRMNTPALVGECGYVVRDFPKLFMPDRLWVAQVDSPYSSCARWLAYLLSFGSFNRAIKDTATGTSGSMKNISKGSLLSVHVPIPTKAEQKAIADVLSDADALIESLEQLIAKKRHLKQGAMQELLRPKPNDEVRLLRDVSTLKGRIGWQGLKQTEFTSNEDEPFLITGMNFKDGAIRWDEVYHISESRYEIAKEIQLRTADLLMTKDGTIGKVLYIDAIPYPGKASLNSHLLLFRPIKGSYNSRYLYSQLSSQRFKDFIELSKSGTTFFGLSQAAVGNYPVLLPPMEEQIRIAAILSDMDAGIVTLEEKLAKARAIKQGMMQELLTGRIRLVRPASNVVPLPVRQERKAAATPPHNQHINEAVVIAVLTHRFATEKFPLGRFRRMKFTYLLHRHVEHEARGFVKQAAGPYNPVVKYGGAEKIAIKSGYVREHRAGQYNGFLAGDNIASAENYFAAWYGTGVLNWLEQFRRLSNDELELLTTVDMAMEDLIREGRTVESEAVKQVIRAHPEWEAKLERKIFSDANIGRAIAECQALFGE